MGHWPSPWVASGCIYHMTCVLMNSLSPLNATQEVVLTFMSISVNVCYKLEKVSRKCLEVNFFCSIHIYFSKYFKKSSRKLLFYELCLDWSLYDAWLAMCMVSKHASHVSMVSWHSVSKHKCLDNKHASMMLLLYYLAQHGTTPAPLTKLLRPSTGSPNQTPQYSLLNSMYSCEI